MFDFGYQFIANVTDMGKIFGFEHEIVGTKTDGLSGCLCVF